MPKDAQSSMSIKSSSRPRYNSPWPTSNMTQSQTIPPPCTQRYAPLSTTPSRNYQTNDEAKPTESLILYTYNNNYHQFDRDNTK